MEQLPFTSGLTPASAIPRKSTSPQCQGYATQAREGARDDDGNLGLALVIEEAARDGLTVRVDE